MRFFILFLSSAFLLMGTFVYADDAETIGKEIVAGLDTADQQDWKGALEKHYGLKEKDLKNYSNVGMSYHQIALVQQMSKMSKKSTSDILGMHEGKQMSWADIAKELKIPVDKLVKAVADIRTQVKDGKFKPKVKPMPDVKKILEQSPKEKSKTP